MKTMMAMLLFALFASSVWAEIFRDNFNDGDLQGWTFVQGAEHGEIQDSALVLSSPKADFGAEVIITVDGIISSNYEVSVSVKVSRLVKDIVHGPHIGLACSYWIHSLSRLLRVFKGTRSSKGFCTSNLISSS